MRELRSGPFLLGLLVFGAALLPRLYALGSFLTIDELKWAEGAGRFLLALQSGELSQTYWHFFPGITIAWGGALALWVSCFSSPELAACIDAQMGNLPESIGWLRLGPVLLTSLGAAGVYLVGRKLIGGRLAWLAALLLAFDPFFIAHSRILNGDAVVAILMFLSLLTFLLYWLGPLGQQPASQMGSGSSPSVTRRSPLQPVLLLSGALAGLALLTKLPAPFIGLFVGGLVIVAMVISWPKAGFSTWQHWVAVLAVWGGMALLLFVALWPAIWVAPLETLRLMYVDTFEVGEAGRGHETFFRGQIVTDPGLWFYPYALAFRLTPVVMVGLALTVGWLLLPVIYASLRITTHLLRQIPSDRAVSISRFTQQAARFTLQASRLLFPPSQIVKVALVMLAYVLFIILLSNVSPKKLDRYVMAVIPAIVLLAAVGLDPLLRAGYTLLNRAGSLRPLQNAGRGDAYRSLIFSLGVIGILVVQLLFAVPVAPYYLTYYNPLLGGVERAATLVPVGWGEGLERAAAFLNNLPQAESLAVAGWYSDIFQPYFVGQQASFSDDGRAQLAADYVVFYVNQVQRQKPYPGLVDFFRAKEPAFVVAVEPSGQVVHLTAGEDLEESVPWVEVYKAPAAQSAGGGPKIEGVAQLLAYTVTGSRVAAAPASSQTGQPAAALSPDELAVTLFLRVLGPLPEQTTFKVALVQNPESQPAGWGRWEATEVAGDWAEGKIVEWRGWLTLSPDLPPGDYRLWVSLETDEGQEVAKFDLSEKDPVIRVEE